MKRNNIINDFLAKHSSAETKRYVSHNVDIAEQIHAILERLGWSQKDLAIKLNKSNAEISKWLSGQHNLTVKSIAKIEAALGEEIITTPQKAAEKYKQVEYVPLTIYANVNQKIVTDSYDHVSDLKIKTINYKKENTRIA